MNFVKTSSLIQIGLIIAINVIQISQALFLSDEPGLDYGFIQLTAFIIISMMLPVAIYYFAFRNQTGTEKSTAATKCLVALVTLLLSVIPSLFYVWYILGLLELIPGWGDALISISLITLPVLLSLLSIIPLSIYKYLISK